MQERITLSEPTSVVVRLEGVRGIMEPQAVSAIGGSSGAGGSQSRRNGSLPVISPRNSSLSLFSRRSASITHGEDFLLRKDKEEVESLESWSTLSRKDSEDRQFHVDCLNQYMSQYTEMDALLMQRKTRSSLPSLTRSATEYQLKHIMEISQRRLEKQSQDQQLKDHAKFSKRHEDDLGSRASELLGLFDEATAQRELLRSKNSSLREQLSAADIAIKVARLSATRLENVLKSKMKSLRAEDLGYVFSKQSANQVELFNKEQEYQEVISRLNAEIAENSSKAAELDARAKEIRQQLKEIQKSQSEHYRKILGEGVDTRNEGLAWAVKALWRLGQKVEADMFPAFLDLESVHVIIFIAQKSMEIEELTAYLGQLQSSTRLSLNSSSHLNRLSDVQERLSALKKPIKTTRPVIASQKQLFPESSEARSGLELTDSSPVSPNTKAVEDRVQSLKKLIHAAQEQELRRIARECFMSNLEQRVKAQARQLLAAVGGADALSRHMTVISKEQKELADELRKAKTFSFSGNAK